MAAALTLFSSACGDPPDPPRLPASPDVPPWETARWVNWAPLDAQGERMLVIDVPGGPVDRAVDDSDVTTALNDKFAPIFLHPRARPDLTARLGWPSLTAVDGDGCVRATGSPKDAAEALALVNDALRARRDGVRSPLPAPRDVVPLPPEDAAHERWTSLHPDVTPDPVHGPPALLWDGKPYLYADAGPFFRCPS